MYKGYEGDCVEIIPTMEEIPEDASLDEIQNFAQTCVWSIFCVSQLLQSVADLLHGVPW